MTDNIKYQISTLFYSLTIIALLVLSIIPSIAQNIGQINGRLYDPISNAPIPFATVAIQGTTIGVQADENGNYLIDNLQAGLYNLQASFVGYKTKRVFEIQVSSSRPARVDIALEQDNKELEAVEVKAKPFARNEESPLSLRSIGINEIKRNPGGNRDISRIVQALPGVATTPSFRNDILIRGGSPSENRFYIDGIEVPTINHFSTQGASGGPVGMINVDFVRDVDFYSGAFPANRGNSLSSVFDFKFKENNPERLTVNGVVSATDIGIMLDAPLSSKTGFIFSARRSYLQFLFKALELPFLPTYNDAQFKVKINLNAKNTLTFMGIGAYDDFSLNTKADKTEDQRALLQILPISDQWNYTLGTKYTHFADNNYWTFVLSRSHLNNRYYKYENNDESNEDNRIVDYTSNEIENKARIENTARLGKWKLNTGFGYELTQYTNDTYLRRVVADSVQIVSYNATLAFSKYALFTQVSRSMFNDRLTASAGLRLDANTYSKQMNNPIKQLSPRISLSYNINNELAFNFNTGLYYQLPTYTALGFIQNNVFVNKNNRLKYISCGHLVAGMAYNTPNNAKISVEGFYKHYNHYPFSLEDSISLANVGGNFGVIGDEPLNSTSQGRSYGLELLFQQKLFKGFYGIVAYTLSWSEFKDKHGQFVPSTWDSRHIINLTAGKQFKRNWEIGLRWRYVTGSPYTPYNLPLSARKDIWEVNPGGVLNFDALNTQRVNNYTELDVRVDKKWYFKRWNFNLYLDLDNIVYTPIKGLPLLTLATDNNNIPLTDPNDENSWVLKSLDNPGGTTIPSLGIIVEF